MYGWTNSTAAGPDGVVWKRFLGPDPTHRYTVERDLLLSLHGRLPVPRVVAERDPWTLGTERVAGRSGLEARGAGHEVVDLHRRLGATLRSLHGLDPATIEAPLGGEGPAVLHGDYGPHNVVVGEDRSVAAVVDWERARLGEPLEDLVWTECVASMLFPVPPDAVRAFYEGYGATFTVEERRAALLAATDAFTERSLRDAWPPGAPWFVQSAGATHRFVDL